MADLSKLRIAGTTYDLKDATARSDISSLDERIEALEDLPWVTYFTGSTVPSNSLGNDGDIYLQTS